MRFYLFNKFPLELAKEPPVASFIIDSAGNVYTITEDYETELLVESPLNKGEEVEDLNATQYKLLYQKIIINKLVLLGHAIKEYRK